MKVAIVGASGETGQSIVNALLSSSTPKFPGRQLVSADLRGPIAPLITLLQGIDIVISAIHFDALADEIPLADAAKAAGVKRFVQSALMIIIPPRGVVDFREKVRPRKKKKGENLHYIQKLRLPYTYIDAGWWHQLSLPRLPSGRVDHLLPPAAQHDGFPLGRDGNVPTALADLRDVGRYVARIIADPRTLNRRVHVYNEVYTLNRVCEVVERVSGEKLERRYVSEVEARDAVDKARMRLAHSPGDTGALLAHVAAQLFYSWGIRGDNTPENAEYLGYLSGKDLYPDFEYVSFEEYIREVLRGEVKGVYQST
ncbi:NAD(P)-binding protein [Aspergillus fijiensis CBS 313.89]|uniref:NAD(P)-binding protein n=1 Tax=Aspergillus fijiensis CBS 313.89 TaxID=1448319 RepID=A0A8G1VYW7_9EURO|nr:NAD(P)-binding protein [Aspergillus fijiensis CBS 313.89]RAK78165.1 NAD(P)-binding protein [Aspergillus fijiensis CBS 313.89]